MINTDITYTRVLNHQQKYTSHYDNKKKDLWWRAFSIDFCCRYIMVFCVNRRRKLTTPSFD